VLHQPQQACSRGHWRPSGVVIAQADDLSNQRLALVLEQSMQDLCLRGREPGRLLIGHENPSVDESRRRLPSYLTMEPPRQWCQVALVDTGGSVLARWALSGEANPNLDAVDLIARWVVIARRAGATVRIVQACPELLELLRLAGLPVEVIG
jgi:hypothetical protein